MKRAVTLKAAGRTCRSPKRIPPNTRKPNYKRLAVVFLTSIVAACGVSFALRTPALRIKSISVTGVKLADIEAVRDAAKYVLGKNLILARKSPAIGRISKISEVASVSMGRVFPDGMWVEVRERKPFAVLTVGSKYYMVQSDGLVFHELRDPEPGLPLVEICDIGQVRLGEIPPCRDISFVLEALKAACHEGICVEKISIDHAGNICLNMESNFCVKLGQPDEIPGKLSQVHRALVGRPSLAQEAAYIDVSCPSAMVWKPKSSAQVAL